MADNFSVRLSLDETIEKLEDEIVKGSLTGQRIDYNVINIDNDKKVILLVYDKHFYRAGNRLTLTITIDNINGRTRVHSIGGGGGSGFFKFDWGASEAFTSAPKNILKNYII